MADRFNHVFKVDKSEKIMFKNLCCKSETSVVLICAIYLSTMNIDFHTPE